MFLNLCEIGQLHAPTGGAHNTFPKTRMLRQLFQFYQYKQDQWDAQLRREEEYQHDALPELPPLNQPELQADNQPPVTDLGADNQADNQPPVTDLGADNQDAESHGQSRHSQTDPSMFAAVTPQEPSETRSVSWLNGLMNGLVNITFPLLFSLAKNMDRDKVKEMAERLLSFPDVVTYCSRLTEVYIKGDPKTVELNKHYGMSVCRLMSPCVTPCQPPCVTTRPNICDRLHRRTKKQSHCNGVRAHGPIASSASAQEYVCV